MSKVWKKIEGISEMKRIILKKSKLAGKNNKEDVTFKTEIHYNIDDLSKSFTTLAKRGYKVHAVGEVSELPLTSRVKVEKREDVKKLLRLRFGEDWILQEELNFFKEAMDLPHATQRDDEEHTCDCLHEEPGFCNL